MKNFIKRINNLIFEQKCVPYFIIKKWKNSVCRKKIYEYKARFLNINTSKYWDNIWKNEHVGIPSWRYYPNKYNTIVSLVNSRSRVLDVGCGLGILMERLIKEKECEVMGIDVSQNAIDRVRKKGMRAEFCKVPPICFQSESFDVVIATEFIEHFPKPLLVIDEVLRVLRKSGILFLSVPANQGPDINQEHLKSYNEDNLNELISKKISNYKILKIKESEGWEAHFLVFGTKD